MKSTNRNEILCDSGSRTCRRRSDVVGVEGFPATLLRAVDDVECREEASMIPLKRVERKVGQLSRV